MAPSRRHTARSTADVHDNAVYHATGVRVRDLPITLDKLLPKDADAGAYALD